MDQHGPVAVCVEYGDKTSATSMARYAWISEDYGRTWRLIFDLADPDFSTGVEAHPHGIAYDPYWDAIWLCVGDGPGNNETFLSLDRGRTWRKLGQPHQFTTIYALPDKIVFVTDRGAPNGVFYIPRTHPNSIEWVKAWRYDENTLVTILGSNMFKAKALPGSPLIVGIQSGSVRGPGRVWASYDGAQWREVWADTGQNAVNHGVRQIVGPSVTGAYLGWIKRGIDLKWKLTLRANAA